MARRKVLVCLGTRPEAIKLAPVIRELERFPHSFSVRVLATAQHREMLDQVLKVFDIRPDIDLDVMRSRQSLAALSASLFCGVERVLLAERPDVVVVQGDTTSALISAQTAFYLQVPVAHVEAGLRTRDPFVPFPEEMNRRLIGALAVLHFAPTDRARANLIREGVPARRIHVTGNTAIDALLAVLKKGESQPAAVLNRVRPGQRVILVTGHRRESFGPGFRRVCRALVTIVRRNPDVDIVYPVHLNPGVRVPVRKALGGVSRIHLVEPLEYRPFVELMRNAYLILTDSGGIQEEAPTLGKPVLVLRDKTERQEGIRAGTAKLVGTGVARIVRETELLLRSPSAYRRMAVAANPYGDGRAAARIRRIMARAVF
uniref:UDP-N-acetylglucosamine 2-epimerase (non-hydrolyzing) n=1 Tax=candidate division WOR-3 bacterium TaxID=2052148 RepID=A0A7C4CA58_UNCW3